MTTNDKAMDLTTNAQAIGSQPGTDRAKTDAPFKDIIITVHGIGIQNRFETVRSVASRLAVSQTLLGDSTYRPVEPQPLGYFHGEVKPMTSVKPLDYPDSLQKSDLASIGFAEVYWADVTEDLVSEGRTLEETKAWARTVAARARTLWNKAKDEKRPNLVPPDFSLVEEVLDEIIDTVRVLENLFFLADKAGVFRFDLADVLKKYISGIQIVAEFAEYRNVVLGRFNTAVEDIYENYCKGYKDEDKVQLHIVSHSEGTVVSLLCLLNAMSGTTFGFGANPDSSVVAVNHDFVPPWLLHIKGFMTFGSPIDKHILLWPRLWEKLKPHKDLDLERYEKLKIAWRNYYDYGDPVGFKLDTVRLWLAKNEFKAFEFSAKDDIGFARYMFPGAAHTQYWKDSAVFEHFIKSVVRPNGQKPVIPICNPRVKVISPLIPYLLSFLLLMIGVFVIYKAVHAYTHPNLEPLQKFVRFTQLGLKPVPEVRPWVQLRTILGVAVLISGATLMARLPRLALGPCWRRFKKKEFVEGHPLLSGLLSCITWDVVGFGAFLLGGVLYAIMIPPEIHNDLAGRFTWPTPTFAIIGIALVGGAVGYLATRRFGRDQDRTRRWFFKGMRPLIICGALLITMIIISQANPASFSAKDLEDAGITNTNDIQIIEQARLTTNELQDLVTAGRNNWIASLKKETLPAPSKAAILETQATLAKAGITNGPEIDAVDKVNLTAEELQQYINTGRNNWITNFKKVEPVLETHSQVWPVLLSGVAFLYLWWLATLIFDLAFVWQRYTRNSVVNDRLIEWSSYGRSQSTNHENRASVDL